jgi:hypothetical protein
MSETYDNDNLIKYTIFKTKWVIIFQSFYVVEWKSEVVTILRKLYVDVE